MHFYLSLALLSRFCIYKKKSLQEMEEKLTNFESKHNFPTDITRKIIIIFKGGSFGVSLKKKFNNIYWRRYKSEDKAFYEKFLREFHILILTTFLIFREEIFLYMKKILFSLLRAFRAGD